MALQIEALKAKNKALIKSEAELKIINKQLQKREKILETIKHSNKELCSRQQISTISK